MRVSGEMKGDPPPQTAPKEPVDAGESAVGIGSAENLDGTGTVPPILSMDADAAATCSSLASSLDPPIEEVGAKPSGQRVWRVSRSSWTASQGHRLRRSPRRRLKKESPSAWMNLNDAEQHAKVVALNVARTPAHHQHILVILVLFWIAFHVSAHAYR